MVDSDVRSEASRFAFEVQADIASHSEHIRPSCRFRRSIRHLPANEGARSCLARGYTPLRIEGVRSLALVTDLLVRKITRRLSSPSKIRAFQPCFPLPMCTLLAERRPEW